MLIIVFVSIIIGIISGKYIIYESYINIFNNYFVPITLLFMIISAGIDIGNNKNILSDLKKHGSKILIIPIGIILGSIIFGIIFSFLLNIPINIGASISSGLGYYSITTAIIKELSKDTSLEILALLTNLFREILSFIFIPFVAKYIGYLETIATAGSNSMDTTLSVISLYTNKYNVIISVINGAILSFIVPILVPMTYKLFSF